MITFTDIMTCSLKVLQVSAVFQFQLEKIYKFHFGGINLGLCDLMVLMVLVLMT